MTNETIINLMIDTFHRFANADPTDAPIDLRDMTIDMQSHTMRCDLIDDITILHFDLDDEMHDLTLIAIYDRDSLDLTSFTINSDSTTQTIDLDNRLRMMR